MNKPNDRLRNIRVKLTDDDNERKARIESSYNYLDRALQRLGFLGWPRNKDDQG